MDINKIRQASIPVFKKYKITKASLFGSVARGEDKHKSDIDFLISPAHGTTLFDIAGMKIDLEEQLGRQVDLVTYGSINPFIKSQVLDKQMVVYEKR